MKSLLLIVITLISLSALAQNKIYIGYSFSPDYSFRTLSKSDGSSGTALTIKSRNNLEQAKFGYTTALKIGYYLSDILSLESGIEFANKGYKIKQQDIIYEYPDPAGPINYKTNFTYQYLGIPLKVKMTFGRQKLNFTAGAGMVTNFLLSAKIESTSAYADGKTKRNKQSLAKDLNKIDITPELSFGIVYRLNNKINLSAEPTFRYGLFKIIDAPVKEKLWNAGLALSIKYDLK